ncbi:MAG: T9SS type A sorting domain-containing protein [Lewinellaceae bacterium]|nr:T9SS type A sorting domain-containing protein [Lewinellaceae bacterium]
MELTIVISSTTDPGIFEQFAVYPNPNNGQFVVRIVAPEAGNEPVVLRLVNALGQVLIQQEHYLSNGELTIPVDQQHLAKGFYWVEIQSGRFSAGKKVVVE